MNSVSRFINKLNYIAIEVTNDNIRRIEWQYFGEPASAAVLTCHLKGRYFNEIYNGQFS
jgi:hypothetical protein